MKKQINFLVEEEVRNGLKEATIIRGVNIGELLNVIVGEFLRNKDSMDKAITEYKLQRTTKKMGVDPAFKKGMIETMNDKTLQ